jgi:biotin carboxyl carrier protein
MAKEIAEIPMPGKILSIKAKVGDIVNEGDELCILEAMKMENAILAPAKGKVVEIKVTLNQIVDCGQVVAVIES